MDNLGNFPQSFGERTSPDTMNDSVPTKLVFFPSSKMSPKFTVLVDNPKGK